MRWYSQISDATREKTVVKGLWGCRNWCWFSSFSRSSVYWPIWIQ